MEIVGFEPTASCMPCKRSSQLSYTPGIFSRITAARNTSATVLLCHIWFNYATGFFIFSHIFSPTLLYKAADKAAHVGAVYGPQRDPLEPAGSFAASFGSVRTAARFTERERVPMRTIHCPDMREKFTATVNSNPPPYVL